MKTGILLVNLGTPNSPQQRDVYKYLIEFLTDPRVIDSSWLSRQLLVRGVIVPTRVKQSAKAYQAIWTDEGSPLKVYGYRLEKALQERLGERYVVALAMRYATPSIREILLKLKEQSIQRLLILPLFPQYASATTGSVHQRVMEEIKNWDSIPELVFVNNFATHPSLIHAFCVAANAFKLEDYDHILFSFHGLPIRQLINADQSGCCQKSESCCQTYTKLNQDCYSAQCYATANAIAKGLNLDASRFSVAFQSRLGKDPWLQPYMNNRITELAKNGYKRVLVLCPSFVCDCLETIYEIGVEYALEFKHAGGERLDLVPGLNDSLPWIDALQDIIAEKLE